MRLVPLTWFAKSIWVGVVIAVGVPAILFALHVKEADQRSERKHVDDLNTTLELVSSIVSNNEEVLRSVINLGSRNGDYRKGHIYISEGAPLIGSNEDPYHANETRFPPDCFVTYEGNAGMLALCLALPRARDKGFLYVGVGFCEPEINARPSGKMPTRDLRNGVDHFVFSFADGHGFKKNLFVALDDANRTADVPMNAYGMVSFVGDSKADVIDGMWARGSLSAEETSLLPCKSGQSRFFSGLIDARCLWYAKNDKYPIPEFRIGPADKGMGVLAAQCKTLKKREGWLPSPVPLPSDLIAADDAFYSWFRDVQVDVAQFSSDGVNAKLIIDTKEHEYGRARVDIGHLLGAGIEGDKWIALSSSRRPNATWTTSEAHATWVNESDEPYLKTRVIASAKTDSNGKRSLLMPGDKILVGVYKDMLPISWYARFFGEGSFVLLGAILGLSGLLTMLNFYFIRPLGRVAAAIKGRSAEELYKIPHTDAAFEVGELATALQELIDKLRQKRAQVENLERTLDGIAHDIKTPVHEIHGKLLGKRNEGKLTDDDRILETRVGRIIERIGLIEKLSQGRKVASSEDGTVTFNVNQWICTLPDSFKDIEVRLCESDVYVHAAAAVMETIVENLWKNARRFRHPKESKIGVGATLNATGVVVYVENKGPRIPVDRQGSLFKRGYTSGGSSENRGLGLALSSEYAEIIGGKLVFVDIDDGARFELHLKRVER